MSSRWERLLEQKPIPLAEHLLEETARLLSAELRHWPLPVGEVEPGTGRALEPLLGADARRPQEAVFRAALRLTRWDLERAHDAYDDYMRNRRYLEEGITEGERPALLFISRWLLEQLLALSEATGGRVKRSALVSILDRLAPHLQGAHPRPA
jgi:hypothetical protein